MSLFTGHRKRKAQNKTRVKYMLVKRSKIQLKQTRNHITRRNCQKNFQTVKVHFTMVMRVIIMMRVVMKIIINSSSYWRVLPIIPTKWFHQFFCKNQLSILPSVSTIVEHLLDEDVSHGLRNQNYIFQKELHFLIDQPRTCYIFILCYMKSVFLN